MFVCGWLFSRIFVNQLLLQSCFLPFVIIFFICVSAASVIDLQTDESTRSLTKTEFRKNCTELFYG
jgi:hypothetical protein